MARGRGRGSTGRGGKSAVRSNNDVTANVPTVPTPAIVTSQADVIGGQNNTNQVQPLIPQIRSTVQTSRITMEIFCSILVVLLVVHDLLVVLVVSILVILLVVFVLLLVLHLGGVLMGKITMGIFCCILVVLLVILDLLVVLVVNMTRGSGTGRGSIGRADKSTARTNMPVRTANMPTIPTPTVAPQTAGGVGAPTSNHGNTSPTTPNQTNPTTVAMCGPLLL
ncbi:hypothetical protein P3L10_004854 [Capsicum annuum]